MKGDPAVELNQYQASNVLPFTVDGFNETRQPPLGAAHLASLSPPVSLAVVDEQYDEAQGANKT